jgi:hypothetical protein
MKMKAGRELDANNTRKQCNVCKEYKLLSEYTKVSKARDGHNWSCKECIRIKSKQYTQSDKGKETRRNYYLKSKGKFNELRRDKRRKTDARKFIGKAVKQGYIEKPETTRDWYNRWEFHHTNYDKPYLGVWVTGENHKKIHNKELECPKPTDHTFQVIGGLMNDFGLNHKNLEEYLKWTKEK